MERDVWYGEGRSEKVNLSPRGVWFKSLLYSYAESVDQTPSIDYRQTSAPKSAMGAASREELVAVPILGAE